MKGDKRRVARFGENCEERISGCLVVLHCDFDCKMVRMYRGVGKESNTIVYSCGGSTLTHVIALYYDFVCNTNRM